MIEKTGTCVSNEKEKVKESQSRRVAPPLDIHFGCRVGGVTLGDFNSISTGATASVPKARANGVS